MQLRILHRTAYTYEEPVKYTAQKLRLTPRLEGRQRTLSWTSTHPAAGPNNWTRTATSRTC